MSLRKWWGEMSLEWRDVFFGCALWYLEITLSKKKQQENDKEDTANISSCDNNQWANEYRETKEIQYSQLNIIYFTTNWCSYSLWETLNNLFKWYVHKCYVCMKSHAFCTKRTYKYTTGHSYHKQTMSVTQIMVKERY